MNKRIRIWAALCAAAILLPALAGCAKKTGAAAQTFTVGFDAEFPPYGYQDDSGEYVGFDLDLAAEVCARRGWKLVKKPIDWDSKDFELDSGTIDCIWNGFTINGREDYYAWTEPYVDNTQVFVVRDGSGITDFGGLAGLTVAVQTGSSALSALGSDDNAALRASFKTLLEVPDYNTAFLDLESGAADAVALDVGVADYQLKNRTGFVKLATPLSSEQYGVGFQKDNTKLRDQVQETLDAMAKDGTFAKIAEKWSLSDMVCLGK